MEAQRPTLKNSAGRSSASVASRSGCTCRRDLMAAASDRSREGSEAERRGDGERRQRPSRPHDKNTTDHQRDFNAQPRPYATAKHRHLRVSALLSGDRIGV
jgi:hypothetical protein